MKILFTLFALGFVSTVSAQSTVSTPDADAAEDLQVAPQAAVMPSGKFQDERNRFLNTLKTEVEPNLIKADIDRLARNVMRLGSYRREWVQKAREFLVANAALSELYLYRYSLAKNERLNREILQTLLALPSYRFPRAALAFAEVLGTSADDKAQVLRVIERAMEGSAEVTTESASMLASSWGENLLPENKLRFAVKACQARAPANRELFNSWADSAQGFWERVLAEELRSCFRNAS